MLSNNSLIALYKKTFGKKIKIKNKPPKHARDKYQKYISWEYIDMFWDWLDEGCCITEAFKIKNKKKLRKRIIELYSQGLSFNVEYEPIYEYFISAVENDDLKIVKMLIEDMAAVYGRKHVFDSALAVSRKNNFTKLTNYLNKKRKYHSDGIPDKIRQIENELFDKYKDFIDSCISLRSKIQALAELIDDKKEKKQRLIYLQKLDEVLNNFTAPGNDNTIGC